MSLAFPSPEFIPPTRPYPPWWDRPWNHPWNELHRSTRIFFVCLVLAACIAEFLPIIDRSDPKVFIDPDQTDFGFPVPYLTIRQHSPTKWDISAFLADIFAVGALILFLTCWMERYMRGPEMIHGWRKIHRRTWIFLAGMMVACIFLEVYPLVRDSDDQIRLADNMRGTHWLGKGGPFTYYRIDYAETSWGSFLVTAPFRNLFDPLILVFDFILLGAVLAEAGYWFEKRQRKFKATAHSP